MNQIGFSIVEGLLAVVVTTVLGGVGYTAYHRIHSTTASSQTATVTTAARPSSTSDSITQLVNQQTSAEASVDSSYSTKDQQTAQSTSGAATAVGGAYDESTL
jgi:hypothetical protein